MLAALARVWMAQAEHVVRYRLAVSGRTDSACGRTSSGTRASAPGIRGYDPGILARCGGQLPTPPSACVRAPAQHGVEGAPGLVCKRLIPCFRPARRHSHQQRRNDL
eukprot:359453-Chlamydomonas_euryale.AAC.8